MLAFRFLPTLTLVMLAAAACKEQKQGPPAASLSGTESITPASDSQLGPPHEAPRPLDLVASTFGWDLNGLLLNPRWDRQIEGTGQALPVDVAGECGAITVDRDLNGAIVGRPALERPCISSAQRTALTVNETTHKLDHLVKWCGMQAPNQIHGHLNWQFVTYEGKLTWSSRSDDADIDFWLESPQRFGYTTYNEAKDLRGLELEFAARETLEQPDDFLPSYSSWRTFVEGVHNAESLVRPDQVLGDGRPAIVTGLFGLDVVHEAHAEVHPVLAMAILVDTTIGKDRRYAMFVRNGGDEGSCSDSLVAYPGSSAIIRHTFEIPLPQGTGPISVNHYGSWFVYTDASHTQSAPVVAVVEGPPRRLIVTLSVPRATSQTDLLAEIGELTITLGKTVGIPGQAPKAESLRVALGQTLKGVADTSLWGLKKSSLSGPLLAMYMQLPNPDMKQFATLPDAGRKLEVGTLAAAIRAARPSLGPLVPDRLRAARESRVDSLMSKDRV